VVGGLAGAAFGLRLVFLFGGVLLLISLVPVIVLVHESERRVIEGPRPSALAIIRRKPGLIKALGVLIGAQGLVTVVTSATQILVVLKLIAIAANAASAAAGFAFGAQGLANSASAVGYTSLTRRFGYVRTTALAALLLGGAVALLIVAPGAAYMVAVVGLVGLLNGTVIPATAAMIGLETPPDAQSTVFGFNASSVAIGFSIGPLIAGGVAASSNVNTGFAVCAVLGVALAGLLLLGAREPAR
jgi:MFS family permease